MHPVDMDKIETWPAEVTSFLAAHSKDLRAEREKDRVYWRLPSDYRFSNPAPPMPRWQEAVTLIENAMADRELLAFHATRLIDFNGVRKEGLTTLDLRRQVARLKSHLREVGAIEVLAEVDAAVAAKLEVDSVFIGREGAVWATPRRVFLQDGGCDVFFGSYGGEALERIAGPAPGQLRQFLKQLGTPAVVIIRYPVSGWCKFTSHALPKCMINLHMRHEGHSESGDCGWDIMIERNVPPENIVGVVPINDQSVVP